MLSQFLIPYLAVLSRAAWNIKQNLEGAGLLSSDMTAPDLAALAAAMHAGAVSGWDPGASVLGILGLLCVACLLFVPFVMLAGYAIGRTLGVLVTAVVLLLPGVASVAGIFPRVAPAPETFVIGGVGVTGDIVGMLSLVVLLVAVGWTVFVLAADSLPIRNKGWEVYDLFWLGLGLTAAVFFIADSQMSQHDASFREAGNDVQRASGYLLKQVEAYISWCRQNAADHAASCSWASHVHPKLLNIEFEDPRVFVKLGPDSSAALYGDQRRAATPAEMDQIRREIAAYNQRLCPVEDLGHGFFRGSAFSPQCEDTPDPFCTAFPDALAGKVPKTLLGTPVALASECVIPNLIRLRKLATRQAAQVEHDHRNRNYRWMYFLGVFSIFLGGKLAGATAKLASFNDRAVGETRRVLRLLGRGAGLLNRAVCRGVAALGEFGRAAARLAWQIVQRGLAKRGSGS